MALEYELHAWLAGYSLIENIAPGRPFLCDHMKLTGRLENSERGNSSCDINDILLMFMSWMISLCVISFACSKLYQAYSLNVSSMYLKLGRLHIGQERHSVGISALKKVTWPAERLHQTLKYRSHKVLFTKWTTVNSAEQKSFFSHFKCRNTSSHTITK